MSAITFFLQVAMNHPIETVGFLVFAVWVWHSAAHPNLG